MLSTIEHRGVLRITHSTANNAWPRVNPGNAEVGIDSEEHLEFWVIGHPDVRAKDHFFEPDQKRFLSGVFNDCPGALAILD